MNDQTKAAMQMALEALEYYKNPTAEFYERIAVELEDKAIAAIREAMEQPQDSQSNYDIALSAGFSDWEIGIDGNCSATQLRRMKRINRLINLARSSIEQPQGSWVDLTDDELESCGFKWDGDVWRCEDADFHPTLRSVIAKFKEKNTPPVVPQGDPVAHLDVTYGRESECYTTKVAEQLPEGTYNLYLEHPVSFYVS